MIDYTLPEHWHEVANLFPVLPPDSLAELASDIKTNGLLNPLVLLDGKVLDGRNRAIACKKAGVVVKTTDWKPNGVSPLAWVMSQNHHRRHLTASQLAVIALESEALFAKEKKRGVGPAAKRAAKAVGAGHSYVVQAKRIFKKDPAMLADIKAGKLTIPEANSKLDFKQSTKAMVSAETNEWYTPKKYVEAARKVLGKIDLDPASCGFANKVIGAKNFYTKETDGLKQEWAGTVWLNPPYGDVGPKFVARLIQEYVAGKVSEAVLLLNSHVTDSKWFQPLFNYVLCFTDHRPKFWNTEIDNSRPTHGGVFVYFGKDPQKFEKHFKQFGAVLHRFPS